MSAGVEDCPLCGNILGESLLTIHTPDRFEKKAGVSEKGYRRDWRDCPGCHAAVNQLSAESLEKLQGTGTNYYEVDFEGSNLRGKYDRVMALPAAASDNAGRVARIRAFLPRGPGANRPGEKTILDIGAGLGVFLAAFLQPGWKGIAIEPDPWAARHLRSLEQFEVIEGIFDEKTALRDLDVITLNKVIEHIRHPLPLLLQVGRALHSQGGMVYVEVPDRETIGRRRPDDNILGALHWHLYSPQALATLLARARLFPLEITRVFEPSGKITLCAFATRQEGFDLLAQGNAP